MKKILITLFALASTAVLISSCRHEPDLSLYPNVVYEPKADDSLSIGVKPILTANCTVSGCHNSSDGRQFSLESYDEVVKGEMVVPGNANKSKLYRCIANRTSPLMPPSGPMTDDAIKTIYLWIEQGAKEN